MTSEYQKGDEIVVDLPNDGRERRGTVVDVSEHENVVEELLVEFDDEAHPEWITEDLVVEEVEDR